MTRVKLHDYLGMLIKIRDDKRVSICMKKQLEEIIENFSEPIIVKVTSVASKSLYDEGCFNDRKLLT